MMKVYFADGTTTVLSIDYCSVVAHDRRVIKAVDLRRNLILFDRTAKNEG